MKTLFTYLIILAYGEFCYRLGKRRERVVWLKWENEVRARGEN